MNDQDGQSNGHSDEGEAAAEQANRHRTVIHLLDNMDTLSAVEAVCSWLRRKVAWYEEHFNILALAVDRSEHGKAAEETEREIQRLTLEVKRWKAIAEKLGHAEKRGA